MKLLAVVATLALITLSGCRKPGEEISGLVSRGRYAGAGIYPAGRMWEQTVSASTTQDAAAATLADDEQVIVVIDSKTGEVRQCGNLSGYCVAMNPWSKALQPSQHAPIPLTKHSAQLDVDDIAAQPAATSAKAAH